MNKFINKRNMIKNKTNLQKGMTNEEQLKTAQKKNKIHSSHPFICLHTEKDFKVTYQHIFNRINNNNKHADLLQSSCRHL